MKEINGMNKEGKMKRNGEKKKRMKKEKNKKRKEDEIYIDVAERKWKTELGMR